MNLLDIAPGGINDWPEEVLKTFRALQNGAPVGENVFFLKTNRTQAELKRDHLLAMVCTFGLFLIALTVGGAFLVKRAWVQGTVIGGIFAFLGSLSWWLWVSSSREILECPWYRSIICTPNHLLYQDMGNAWVVNLKDWHEVTLIVINHKGWKTYSLVLKGPSGNLNMGNGSYFSYENLEEFADKLHQHLRSRKA